MSIIIALIVFSILVVVHEWGHYIAAVKCGVNVEEFAIGMGPAIYKRQGKKTLFSIRCLPIGGYCKMTGEDEASDDVNAFCNKNVWQKIVIVVAGALMNIIYAIVILMVIPNFMYTSTREVYEVDENSPAYIAGIQKGDELIGVNGKEYGLIEDIKFELALDNAEDSKMEFIVNRDGKKLSIPVTYTPILLIAETGEYSSEVLKVGAQIEKINGKNIMDIEDLKSELDSNAVAVKLTLDNNEYQLNENEIEIMNLNRGNKTNYLGTKIEVRRLNPIESIGYGLEKTRYYISTTYKSIKLMVTGNVSKDQVSGPVGIIKMISDTYTEDIKSGIGTTLISLLSFSAMLSINLGVINLLPLPALDGGRFFILLIEVIRRKPMDQEKESWIHFVGFILLMILMVVVLFNDVTKLLGF